LDDLKSLLSEIMLRFSEIYVGEEAMIKQLREDIRTWREALVKNKACGIPITLYFEDMVY
jgi:hypothetical protein